MSQARSAAPLGASRGGELYRGYCSSCHGTVGDGKGPAGPATDFTTPAALARLTDATLMTAIRDGHPPAVAAPWRDHPQEDIALIATYVREALMLPSSMADTNLGKRLYARHCSVCHGDRGDGASWARNGLNPPPFDFTSAKAKSLTRLHMLETVTSGREKTAMVGWGRKLSAQQIEAVVDYVRASFVDGTAPAAMVAAVPPAPPAPAAHAHAPPAEPRPPAQTAAAPAAGGHGHGDAHAAHAGAMPPGLVGNARAGEDLYRRNCVACHGEQGNGQGPRAYFINPKPQNFTSAAARSSLDRAHLYASISRGVNGTEMPAWEKVLTPQQIADLGEYVFTRFIQPAPGAAAETPRKN